ncbi:hypothetical protein MD484_g4452, partial [Candolleomyces efflorescens]
MLTRSLSSSRPAPPSPALSATGSVGGGGGKAGRRVSTASTASLTRGSGSNNNNASGSGTAGGGTGGNSRPPSGVFTLSRGNSVKRLSGLGGAFRLPSPVSSPTQARFWGSSSSSPSVGGGGIMGVGGAMGEVGAPPLSAGAASFVSEASTVVPVSSTFFTGSSTTTTTATTTPSSSGPQDSFGPPGSSAQGFDEMELREKEREQQEEQQQQKNKKNKNQRTMYIKVKDFAFEEGDERFCGMGEDVPKCNRVGRMNRRLRGGRFGYDPSAKNPDGRRTFSQGSWSSFTSTDIYESDLDAADEDEGDDDDEEEDDGMNGWGFSVGLGRLSWGVPAASSSVNNAAGVGGGGGGEMQNGFPSRSDLDRNFLDDDDSQPLEDQYSQDEDQQEEDEDDAEDPLYPGIYRALFAFTPEGTAEVGLREDQLVRVIKRGGGVGWAVVEMGWRASRELVEELRGSGELETYDNDNDDDRDDDGDREEGGGQGGEGRGEEQGGVTVLLEDGRSVKQGLVPESYLAPVRLDGWVDAAGL